MANTAALKNWRLLYLAFVAAVMLAPFVIGPFVEGWVWGAEDFAAAALLLGGAWVVAEQVNRFVPSRTGRVGIVSAIAVAVLAIWAQLAVQL